MIFPDDNNIRHTVCFTFEHGRPRVNSHVKGRGSFRCVNVSSSSFPAKKLHRNDITLKQLPRLVHSLKYFFTLLHLSHMISLSPRILRTAIQLSHTSSPTKPLIRTFKPQILAYQPPIFSYATATRMETNNQDLQLSNLFDVKGKVALVTGGGSSITLSDFP